MNDKEYTKHYFIEGEKVCSKLGGGFGMVHDPTQNPVDPIKFDYKQIPKDLWEMVVRGIECVEFNPENVKIEPDLPPAYNMENATERDQFFYHSDHLGSSSFITNINGAAVQHLQYLPFGETYVDQRHDSPYNTPYKFSGKEKDDETQYSYFGARYYDSDLSVWLSVDPLSDKYYSTSPFMYCIGNPLKLIDPNGMDTSFRDNSSRKTFNETYSNVYSRVNSYDKKIENKLSKWKTIGYGNAKTNKKFTRQIRKLNESRAEITELKTSFDEIINSKTMFEYVNDETTLAAKENGSTMKLDNGNILINFRTGLNSSLIHENRHGFGRLIGEGPSYIGSYDYMDEYEAFRQQQIYDPISFQTRLEQSGCISIGQYVEKYYSHLNSGIVERWEQICE